MTSKPRNPITATIVAFLHEIGLEAVLAELANDTFLPGIDIQNGVLLIDESKLLYPGDILHEAGHLAIMPRERRRTINHNAGSDPGEEMSAIAWSYAAAVHLNIDLSIVFHERGYRGGSKAILRNFSQRRYIGVPVLEWLGMTVSSRKAQAVKVEPYPHMAKWTVDR